MYCSALLGIVFECGVVVVVGPRALVPELRVVPGLLLSLLLLLMSMLMLKGLLLCCVVVVVAVVDVVVVVSVVGVVVVLLLLLALPAYRDQWVPLWDECSTPLMLARSAYRDQSLSRLTSAPPCGFVIRGFVATFECCWATLACYVRGLVLCNSMLASIRCYFAF